MSLGTGLTVWHASLPKKLRYHSIHACSYCIHELTHAVVIAMWPLPLLQWIDCRPPPKALCCLHHHRHPCVSNSVVAVWPLSLITSPRLLPALVNNNEDEDDNFDSSDDEIMNTRRGNRPSNYLSRLPPPFQHHSKQTFSIAITTSSTTTSSSMTLTPTRINNRKNGSTVTTMTMSMTSMLPPKFTTTGSYAFTHDVWAIHQWRYACCHCHYTMKYVTQPI